MIIYKQKLCIRVYKSEITLRIKITFIIIFKVYLSKPLTKIKKWCQKYLPNLGLDPTTVRTIPTDTYDITYMYRLKLLPSDSTFTCGMTFYLTKKREE